MPPPVLVTRPAREAERWVLQLAGRGIGAEAFALIDIVPEPMAGDLADARTRLGDYHAAMFVSGNAVDGFLQPNQALETVQQALAAIDTRAWSPGPGTTAALLRAGWPAARIDAPAHDAPQFDSESLWAVVHGQIGPGDRVLIVRGTEAGATEEGTGRDWLARQIQAAGGQVDFVVAYTRGAPRWSAEQQTRARAAAVDGSLWLLSSSQAVDNLCATLSGQDWSQARALATHPRIAQAARAAGFGSVRECRPALDDVVASIESAP